MTQMIWNDHGHVGQTSVCWGGRGGSGMHWESELSR